jgi:tRNA modification GTPase
MSTIVALSTPMGRAAIAVVRLSGSLSLSIAKGLCVELDNVKPRRATLAQIRYPPTGEILDEVLISFFKGPHSVTGEDVVEISCHGSPAVVRQILDLTLHLGARLADPGEFTLRALSNRKINLSQAEAIRDLIAAQTQAAVKQASRQIGGELSTRLDQFKDRLIKVIVLLESALEFVEDDLPLTEVNLIEEQLGEVRHGINGLAQSYAAGRLLQEGVKVAIIGSPNVGKSSLFNRLVDQDRAIVTPLPGTTRDTLSHSIDIGGVPVVLTDTAGLRETNDGIERLGIERTHKTINDADVVLNVLECTNQTEGALDHATTIPSIIVLNKCDLQVSSHGPKHQEGIRVSALTGEGLDTLRAAILQILNRGNVEHEGLVITNARHYNLLNCATQGLDEALELIRRRASEELIVVPLNNALKFLGQITGEITTEDILSQIFSTFCIGK